MSYENQLIRESTGEGMGQPPWCSACERDAEDCVCEELSDHFNELDAAYAISAEAPARSEPAGFLERAGSKSAVRRTCQTDKTGSGGDVCCVPASSEPCRLQLMYGGPRSFTEWLESHGDYLPLPNSFQEWLDRGNDAI